MVKQQLPHKGDIFARTKPAKRLRLPHLHYKPKFILKTVGLITSGIVLLLGTSGLVAHTQISEKQLADSPTTITTADNTGNTSSNTYRNYGGDNCYNSNYQGYNSGCNPSYNYSPPMRFIDINPNPNPGFNFNPSNGSGNVNGTSSQIIAVQQQIGAQMQACANNARQMANQIVALKNQINQFQRQIDNLNDQMNRIDTSTDAGQRRRDSLDRQIQQMQQQMDTMNQNFSRAQDNFNTNNDRCHQAVDNLVQQREDLEGKLNDAFNQSMDIQFPF